MSQIFVDETRNEVIVNEDQQIIIVKDVGTQGQAGVGVPVGGSTDQYLKKQSGTDYETAWATINSDEISEGTTNKFYTDERVDDRVDALIVEGNGIDKAYNDGAGTLTLTVDESELDHANLQNVGTNSHAQIDSHIASTYNPHSVTKTQVGLSEVTNDLQLKASDLDTDGTLSANSDVKVPSQKAVKTYVDANAIGEVNTASNLGTGEGVFSSKSGVDLQFKSLTSGAGISLTGNANDVQITSTITQYTDSQAKAAAVADSITDGITDVAPSQNAVFDALAGKEPTLSKGNLTEVTSSVLTITGGTNAVIGSGTSIQVAQANGSTNGYLSSSDWTTFNGKQNALGFTPENVANKSTNTSLGTSDTLYPSQNAVKSYVDTGLSGKQNTLGFTPENVANKDNGTLTTSTTTYPTSNAVKTAVDAKANRSGDTFTGAVIPSVVTLTDATTISVNATLGNQFTVTLGGNRTLGNPTGAVNGQLLLFAIRQDGGGNRTLALDTKFRLGTDITNTTLSTASGKTDYLGVRYHSADDRFDVISFVKGY